MKSIDSHARWFISAGSRPNVTNSSYCDPGPTPRSNRPPDRMSVIAASSATRIGSWNGSNVTAVPIRKCSVRAATAVATSIGEPVHWHSRKWCSPYHDEVKPSSSASTASPMKSAYTSRRAYGRAGWLRTALRIENSMCGSLHRRPADSARRSTRSTCRRNTIRRLSCRASAKGDDHGAQRDRSEPARPARPPGSRPAAVLTDIEASELPRFQSGFPPQHVLLTLIGEYGLHIGDPIPSASLVLMLGEFGITQAGARAAIARLARRGILVATRSGRTTAYAMTDRCAWMVAEGRRLTLEFTGAHAIVGRALDARQLLDRPGASCPAGVAADPPAMAGLCAHAGWALDLAAPTRQQLLHEALADLGVGSCAVFVADPVPGPTASIRSPAWDLDEARAAYAAVRRRVHAGVGEPAPRPRERVRGVDRADPVDVPLVRVRQQPGRAARSIAADALAGRRCPPAVRGAVRRPRTARRASRSRSTSAPTTPPSPPASRGSRAPSRSTTRRWRAVGDPHRMRDRAINDRFISSSSMNCRI